MHLRKVSFIAVPVLVTGLLIGNSPAMAATSNTNHVSRTKARATVKADAQPVSDEIKQAAIAAALSKVGTARYVPGGQGPNRFDCSGLVAWSYGQAGFYLPHGSDNQLPVVLRISRAELQPGDLIFSGRGKGGVSHVSMYIGDGKVVHATRPGVSRKNMVRIDDIDSNWVMNHIAYGRVVQ